MCGDWKALKKNTILFNSNVQIENGKYFNGIGMWCALEDRLTAATQMQIAVNHMARPRNAKARNVDFETHQFWLLQTFWKFVKKILCLL